MSNNQQDVYIVEAKRTAVGKAGGQFQGHRPDSLLSKVFEDIHATHKDIQWDKLDDVIVGCAMPEGEQGMNVARLAALAAKLPHTSSGMTINRFCSSGLQAVSLAANQIASGQADLMLAGGVESMSMVPMGGNSFRPNPQWFEDESLYPLSHTMGITAEAVASEYGIDRELQDNFALKSHQKALEAIEKGLFKEEIVSIDGIDTDQGPRAGTIDALAKLRPVFKMKGSVTAGNSSQMSDGAAALLLASESFVKENNLTPIGRFKGFSVAGCKPEVMGIGPVHAIPKVMKQTQTSLTDIDWIELNEAFAAQALAVIKTLDLDQETVNPYGGAIALGHPLGATGAIRLCTALWGLKRTKNTDSQALVSMCIGTGMGAAGVVEVFA